MCVCPEQSRSSPGDLAWLTAFSLEIFTITVGNYSQIALHAVPVVLLCTRPSPT